MYRPVLLILGICLLRLFGSQCWAQGDDKQPLRSLDDYLMMKLARDHIPGLAASIVRDDGVVWAKGYGHMNLARGLSMTPQSVVGIASVSKLFTATAVLQLAERKQLSLDDPINRYLPFSIHNPDYPEVQITISQLLSHTSSISNGPSLWRTYSCDKQKYSLKEWVRAYFLPEGEFYHKEGNFSRERPGKAFLYSNAGYTLLAYVVEVVSGQAFEQYCRRNIFLPLDMRNTSFVISDVPVELRGQMYSYGYNMDLERDLMEPGTDCGEVANGDYFFPLCHYTTPTIGASGLYSCSQDLTHFLIALMNDGRWQKHVILSTLSIERLLTPNVDSHLLPGKFHAFGLGAYAMVLNNGAPVWGHTGADPGMSTYMLFSPETRIGAVVLANRFVDIRDLIEWVFAEGVREYWSLRPGDVNGRWKMYGKNHQEHRVEIRVTPNYLPGGSGLFIVGNHRFLGCWVGDGIPLIPQADRSWAKTFWFPDSTVLAFKITRGGMSREAVTNDGMALPDFSCIVTADTTVCIKVEDWKDQAQQ